MRYGECKIINNKSHGLTQQKSPLSTNVSDTKHNFMVETSQILSSLSIQVLYRIDL